MHIKANLWNFATSRSNVLKQKRLKTTVASVCNDALLPRKCLVFFLRKIMKTRTR